MPWRWRPDFVALAFDEMRSGTDAAPEAWAEPDLDLARSLGFTCDVVPNTDGTCLDASVRVRQAVANRNKAARWT
jgi:hypothetical protein